MAAIETVNIPGCSVYGVQQVQYAVDGSARCDYGRALAAISLTRATAIEGQAVALSALLRLRLTKAEELGVALAEISRTNAQYADKKVTEDVPFPQNALDILNKYNVGVSTSRQRGELQKIESRTKFALDKEQNEVQQDNLSLQNMMSKRDQAFNQASSLMKKVYDDMGDQIRKLGG